MTTLRHLLTALLVIALLTSGIAGAATTAAAQSNAVFLSAETSTTPDQPTAGDEFDLDVTITSAEAGTNNAYISRISLVDSKGQDPERYETDSSIGQVSPGDDISHTMQVELDEERTYDLYLDITVNAAGRTFHVYEPVTIEVYDGHPVLEAQAAESMPGRFTDLSVSVGNGLEEPIRNVELDLAADDVEIEQPRRVASRVDAGETRTFDFQAKTDSAGEKPIEATIRYTTADGDRRHVTRTLDTAFSQPAFADDVSVSGQVAPAFPGAQTELNLTVSNGLDVSLRQLEVSVSGDGVDIPQPERVSGGIESGETRAYTFAVTKDSTGQQAFEVELSYITANGASQTFTRTVQAAFTEPRNPGEVSLTGLQVEREGDTLFVSGTASNIGGSEVAGVTVAVDENDAVMPGRSQAEFFVGSIPESDFVSFDVNARLVENTSRAQIPLVVSYTVDGVRLQETVTVPYEPEPEPANSQGNGGLPLSGIAIGLVVVLALAAGVVYWRRS